MPQPLRIALAQVNVTVGDFQGNAAIIRRTIESAKAQRADIVAFPELAITGYPPEDLLLRPQFIRDNVDCLQQIARDASGITAIIGFADSIHEKIYNAAAVLSDGRVAGVYHKIFLPNYSVFDEKRYFEPGNRPLVFEVAGVAIGLNICEDIWIKDSVTETQALTANAEVILNISASPFHYGKVAEREQLLKHRAMHNRAAICYVNIVGGQDELVFDGNSLILDENGAIVLRGKQFEPDLVVCDIDVERIRNARASDRSFQQRKSQFIPPFKHDFLAIQTPTTGSERPPVPATSVAKLDPVEEIYRALVLGTRDYVRKNGFSKVVLGLSGGIDSALTAAISVDALGAENVIGVSMPSIFSSESSKTDAEALARNLNITFLTIPIQETFEQYQSMLREPFANRPFDIAEENIQARIRGNIIMALSNKFGWLALTTGNKSEVSVGYCTLYGDMAGGLAVIKDVPKTVVYQLSQLLNETRGREVIPQNTIAKPPSAELRPNQKDEDSLPPYDILDPILVEYVENNATVEQVVAAGFDERTVRKVIHLVDMSEYKRRQGPPGIKITPRAFGRDRRMPITNRYHKKY
ncbi:MAG: NAD+ synthase [Candidatus Zhuqueibacterota bacterium]